MAETGAPERLHPASLLFSIGGAARRLLLPGILLLLLARGERYELWFMVLFLPAVLAAAARYATFRWTLGPDELILRHGLLTRNERHIPYDRIQNIDLVQNPVHRALGVAEVRIETAGGSEPEALLRVLALDTIERMRAHVFRDSAARAAVPASDAGEPAPVPREDESRTLVRLAPSDLFVVGLTSHRGLALVAAGLGLVWQLEPFDVVDEGRIRGAIESVDAPPALVPAGTVGNVVLALVAVMALFVLLQILSVAWAFVKFHGFTLRIRGEDLRADYGLLTRISATIPLHRVQLLSWRDGPVHRAFGRVAVLVETAGGGGRSDDGSEVERLWIAPAVPAARLGDLLGAVLPEVRPAEAEWRPVAPGARRRLFRRGAFLAALVAALLVPFVGAWAVAVLVPGVVLGWVHADRWTRSAGWAELPQAVLWRSGWWTRRTSVVPFGKVQALSLRATPFDRRSGMGSLLVDTAGAGRAGHRVDLRYLPEATARTLLARVAAEAGSRPFRW